MKNKKTAERRFETSVDHKHFKNIPHNCMKAKYIKNKKC